MSNVKKLLGNKIKQIRKNKNLTQEELSELINIEVPSLSNIERGKFAPSIETLQKLSSALDVQMWEFYYFNTLTNSEMLDEINIILKQDNNLIKTVFAFLKSIE